MVRFAPLLSLFSLGLATAVQASLFTVSEPVVQHFDKPNALPVKRGINAERMAQGLGPAMPRALGDLLPMRSRRDMRVKNYRRQGPTPSMSPPTEPQPKAAFSQGTDDAYVTLTLPFEVQIYGTSTSTLFVSSNGFITTSPDGADLFTYSQLPASSVPGAAVFLYWTDLAIPPDSGYNVFIDVTANRVAIRCYDKVPAIREFTVGTQASSDSSPRKSVTVSYNQEGQIYDGLTTTIDTNTYGSNEMIA